MNERIAKISCTNCDPDTSAYMESYLDDQFKKSNADQKTGKKYYLHIHSRRKRLCDPDGISAKAFIDGVVGSGLLPDDNSEWIEEITFTQEKSDIEETIMEIWES